MKDYQPDNDFGDIDSFFSNIHTPQPDDIAVIDGRRSTDGKVTVPLGNELLHADFSRNGHDLYIYHDHLVSAIVQDYFSSTAPAALVSESGMRINGHAVELLAGNQADGQFAGPQTASDPIGTVEKLQGDVHVKHVDGTETLLKQGDHVFQDDVIHTGSNGDVGIKFIDGSVFTLGSDARMTIDDLVYDPQSGEGHSDVSVVNGMFKFVSGDISANNPGDMKIHTPVATIGIRGTTGGGNVEGAGHDNHFYLEPNADGTIGWIDVITDKGKQSLNQPNMVVSIQNINQTPPAPLVVPPAALQQQFGEVMQFAPPVDKYNLRLNNEQGQQPNQPQGEIPAQENQNQPQNAEGQPQAEANAAPSEPNAQAAQPNAQMVTDQQVAAQTPTENANPNPDFKPFSGDAAFDGQAANAEAQPTNTPPAFIPTSIASADVKPGFTTAGDQGFVSVSEAQLNSAFAAPPTMAGQSAASAANLAPAFGPDGAPATGNPLTGDTTTTTLLGGALGDVLPPAAAGNATFAPPAQTAANTAAGFNTPDASHAQNVQIDQGLVPPGAAVPPAAAQPPVPPAGNNNNNTGANPPTAGLPGTGTGNGGAGSGANAGSGAGAGGAGTEAGITNTLTAASDNFTGGSGNDIFKITAAGDWIAADTIKGGDGFDSAIFAAGYTWAANDLQNKSGIEDLVFMANSTLTLNDADGVAFVNSSSNGNVVIHNGSNNVTLDTSLLAVGHDVYIAGGGTISLTDSTNGNGNRVQTQFGTNTRIVSGDNDSDYIIVNGGSTTVDGGAGDGTDTYIFRGGSNHRLNSSADNSTGDKIYALGVYGASLTGGTGSDKFDLINTSQTTLVGGGTNGHEFILEGNSQGNSVQGGSGNDTFELSGNGSNIVLNSGSASDDDTFNIHDFFGSVTINADSGASHNDKVIIRGLHGNIQLNVAGAGSSLLDLQFTDKTYNQLNFASLDLDADGAVDDLRIGAGDGQVYLMNFFAGTPKKDLKLTTMQTLPEFAILKGPDVASSTTVKLNDPIVGYNAISDFNGQSFSAGPDVAVYGSGGNDTITGNTGNTGNTYLKGFGGDDVFYVKNYNIVMADYSPSGGAKGNDTFIIDTAATNFTVDGGEGFDVVDFSNYVAPVTIDFSNTTIYLRQAANIGIDAAIGGQGDDSIKGYAASGAINYMEGGLGRDSFTGGAGATNTVSYEHSAQGVTIDLNVVTQSSAGTEADQDDITGVDNVVGSSKNDMITGNGNQNTIYGGDGNDTIKGQAGGDLLIGGNGADEIWMDNGTDDNVRDRVMFDVLDGQADTVINFRATGNMANQDMVELTPLLNKYNLGNLNYFDLVKGGYLGTEMVGGALDVKFDWDGSNGGAGAVTLAHLNGVSSLGWNNFLLHGEAVNIQSSNTTGSSFPGMLINTTSGAVIGGAGNEILFNLAPNGDYQGNGGDDTLVVNLNLSPGIMNGGAGDDKLKIINGGAIDMSTGFANTTNIETLDISGNGGNYLTGLTATRVNAINSQGHELNIMKDASDVVDLSGWVQVNEQVHQGYTTYISGTGGAVAMIHVQNT